MVTPAGPNLRLEGGKEGATPLWLLGYTCGLCHLPCDERSDELRELKCSNCLSGCESRGGRARVRADRVAFPPHVIGPDPDVRPCSHCVYTIITWVCCRLMIN